MKEEMLDFEKGVLNWFGLVCFRFIACQPPW